MISLDGALCVCVRSGLLTVSSHIRTLSPERYLDKPYGALALRTPDRNKWPWQSAAVGAKL